MSARPLYGSHSDTSAINIKNMVSDLFGQMREPSPSLMSPKGSSGSLRNGSVTKNLGFQQQNAAELPWSSPAISLPGNCNSNLATEPQPALVKSTSNASALTSLCVDLSPSDSHFFEVLYIGKVRISQRKVPESLIDDALFKFAQHEAEKIKNQRRHSLLSSITTSEDSSDSGGKVSDFDKEKDKQTRQQQKPAPLESDKLSESNESVQKLKVDPNEIDKEFDMFSKERVEKNLKKPTLESLIAFGPKNNLGTVDEDEEKLDSGSVISDTASSITQFCQNDVKDSNTSLRNNESLTDIYSNWSKEGSPNLNFNEYSKKSKASDTVEGDVEKCTLPENKPFLRNRSASIGSLNAKTPIAQLIGEQNRTMLFQVGRAELRLISPDRKQILLYREFKDVASCVLGRANKEHFGFVCRETNESYACYVFKCESDSVAGEVINAIRQAFIAHAELLKKSREKSPNTTCEHCPMLWYHRLCHDIEGMNDKKTHAFILRRVEQLPEDEQDLIITKYQGGTNHMYEVNEHNSFLMMLLRAHCEAKQMRHVHDTAENRSEFLNQYLGGSTIFMKAKRSLSSGFDHLLKRRASKDDISMIKKEQSPLPTSPPVETQTESQKPNINAPIDSSRCKSLSPATPVHESGMDRIQGLDSCNIEVPIASKVLPGPVEEESEDAKTDCNTPINSPMMDIFLKVSDARAPTAETGAESEATWRQAIYEKAVHPVDNKEDLLNTPPPTGKRSREDLRKLWKMAIDQTLLLVRMERENTKLKESEESSAVRRIKLEYADLGVCDAGVALMWDSLLARDSADHRMLTQAVIQGVPRVSRGGVWYFLAEQAAYRAPPPDTRHFPLYHAPYRSLLAGLTKHQHAILIDLGRTFPKHSYFASALGPGQLALYNILKAYSLLDPDVGYCQGLSFVAGVLLLHMEEAEAFILLRHLMFRRGLRKQYLPDMSALQVQLYQLSRLLRDHEPELHAKLESLDISPALYAAPWMLTLFTSQFPLGFVVRVFDLIFLESLDVVFAVSLALLSVHKDGLMLCESCEEAAEYLKHKLPDVNKSIYNKVMKRVHSLDISRQLNDYSVEYAVLREEIPRMATLTEDNRHLVMERAKMSDELDSAMDAISNYQKTQARLETHNKSMEQQLNLLCRYISAHHRQDMPMEIKKIVQIHSKKLSFGSKITSFGSKFTGNEEDDEPKKVFKTGVSAPNLFSKITKEDILNAVNRDRTPETEKKPFLMKKSQSVHSGLIANNLKNYPLKVLDEKMENDYREQDSFRNDILLKNSLKELGKRNTGFFANTHEQIRQERLFEMQLKQNFDDNLRKLDDKLYPNSFMNRTSNMDDINIFQGRKSMSLNLQPNKRRDKDDSGFVTPLSPDDRRDDTISIVSHPLSDCDVDIKFDGQSTKLKQIRPIKHPTMAKD